MQAQEHDLHSSLESSIDKSPYVNFMEDGMVAALTNDGPNNGDSLHNEISGEIELNDSMAVQHVQQNQNTGAIQNESDSWVDNKNSSEGNAMTVQAHGGSQEQREEPYKNKICEAIGPVKKSINQLSRSQGKSVWLLAYIALVTSWPLLGAGFFFFRKRFSNSLLARKLKKL